MISSPKLKVCSYNKCDGSGLVPSKVLGKFSGKPIPNCFSDCECKGEEIEHYHPISPDDFDFPISYSFYRSLCQYHGWPDPGSDTLPERSEEPPTKQGIQPAPRELRDSLHKTQVYLNDLTNRLNKHIDASKQKGKYVKYT